MSHHFYAATATDWRVADTREDALKAVVQAAGRDVLKRQKERAGGIAATVCRVELPATANYTISDYKPHTITKEDGVNESRKGERVPLSEIEQVRITTMQGKTIPDWSDMRKKNPN